MIALCRQHHDKADAGAFTEEQLRRLKEPKQRKAIGARFDWRHHPLMAVIGGSFYYEPRIVFRYRGANVLFFTVKSEKEAVARYQTSSAAWSDTTFPVTAVSITMNVPGTNIAFGPRLTRMGGARLRGGYFRNFEVALDIID